MSVITTLVGWISTGWNWLGNNSSQVQTIILFITAIVIAGSVVVTMSQVRYSAKQVKYSADQLKYTAEQLKHAAAQTQGVTIQEISRVSRDLFIKAIDDPGLRILTDPAAENINPHKVCNFIGVLIQHYATTFLQWRLGNIPNDFWDMIELDCKEFFQNPLVLERWNVLKSMYKGPFVDFVEQLKMEGGN